MADSAFVNRQIQEYENRVDIGISENTIYVTEAVLSELYQCMGSGLYAHICTSKIQINIGVELSEEQRERLINSARRQVRNFYYAYKDIGLNDQAIAELGSRIKIIIGEY